MKSETGHAGTRKASLSVGAAALACVGVAWWYYASAGPRHSTPNPLADMPGSYCEEGISAARAKAGLNSGEARATAVRYAATAKTARPSFFVICYHAATRTGQTSPI